ncbi:unnamed protein product [Knipowitschia caucasica]
MMESARFSRGQGMMQMNDLSNLDVKNFDAVIFLGGHGVTKNLSSFTKDRKDCKINSDVERVQKDFHRSHKPIGLASLAPLLACRVLPGLLVTMGYDKDEENRWGHWPNTNMVQTVKNMGAHHNASHSYPFMSPDVPLFLFKISFCLTLTKSILQGLCG